MLIGPLNRLGCLSRGWRWHLILKYSLLLNDSDELDGFASFRTFDQLVYECLLVALLHSKVLDRVLEDIE